MSARFLRDSAWTQSPSNSTRRSGSPRRIRAADGSHPRERLHVIDNPGDELALVLMLGFPDDSHSYDKLVPVHAPRRVVAFDFFGYGRSDRAEANTGTDANHHDDLVAVVDSLGLEHRPRPATPRRAPSRSTTRSRSRAG
jgi:pimeloyl-ACP methyl ester carboxylesterase